MAEHMESNAGGSSSQPTFSDELVLKLIKFFDDSKEKKNNPSKHTVQMVSEALRLFVVEAIQRAASEVRANGGDTIKIQDVQNIVGQLLLDF